jgi:hypothetical protein
MLIVTRAQLEAGSFSVVGLEVLKTYFKYHQAITLDQIATHCGISAAVLAHHMCPKVTEEQTLALTRQVTNHMSLLVVNMQTTEHSRGLIKGMALIASNLSGYGPDGKEAGVLALHEVLRAVQWSHQPWLIELTTLVIKAVMLTDTTAMVVSGRVRTPYFYAVQLADMLDKIEKIAVVTNGRLNNGRNIKAEFYTQYKKFFAGEDK